MSISKAIVRALALDKAITTLAGVRGGTRPEINARRRIFMQLIDAGPAGSTRSVLAGRKDYRTGAAQFDQLVTEGCIESAPWPPDADGRTKPRWRLSASTIEQLTVMSKEPLCTGSGISVDPWKWPEPESVPEPEVETFWNQRPDPDHDPEPVSTHEDFWSQPNPEPVSMTESFWECHDPDCHDPDRPNPADPRDLENSLR